MPGNELKPLNWEPSPNIGYTVTRRSDGGMHFVFQDITHETLTHWRNFSLQHLYDSDRLTCNLYDLRQLAHISEEAIRFALEVSSDPATRNIRLAVVVASEEVLHDIEKIEFLATESEIDMAVFVDIDDAEAWLARPLTLTI